jgi:hypothetical protein
MVAVHIQKWELGAGQHVFGYNQRGWGIVFFKIHGLCADAEGQRGQQQELVD